MKLMENRGAILLRIVCMLILASVCEGALNLRGSTSAAGARKLDDADGGFDQDVEYKPDSRMTLDQEGSLDQIEKMEALIHSEKVDKILEKARVEVKAYSKDFAQESSLDRLERLIDEEKNMPGETIDEKKTLEQLGNLIKKEKQMKANDAMQTTSDEGQHSQHEEEEEASLDSLESLLKKEETKIRREEESFSGVSHADLEQALFNGEAKVVQPQEELDEDKRSVTEEDSSMGSVPRPETDRENVHLEAHVEENQYKWLKKKLGKQSKHNKKYMSDGEDEEFDSTTTRADEAGSVHKMDAMEGSSFGDYVPKKDSKSKIKNGKKRKSH